MGAAVLTAEGRGGGRANSQPPAEVLSGGSCVPPDSWHGEGVGSTPTSCAQLSPWPHSASPAVPCPAAGLLNWRFVAAQGNNTAGVGGGGKEGKQGSWGCCRRMLGAVRGRTAGKSRNGRHQSRRLRKKSGSQRGDSSLGTRSGQRDGEAEPQEAATDAALKALESSRDSHLTEALAAESSRPFQPLLSLPEKYLGCVDPAPCLPHKAL